ncbi:Protein kinase [Orpheovirus IHUMI-LCC2]|uniref:Protein kinase n=1 Tax=Orpheovirus IHUMI-LCC2 TaxID=2023057 RepID=A0A2I2L510_9VIRU|nr:Protein kinase [Orpheovirus IHUMI-LCC2]SNW62614.1 Protein kinase [Orpheovirus IHUMI-LCC2]
MDITKGEIIEFYIDNEIVSVYSININGKKYVVKKGRDINIEGPILEKLTHPNIIKLYKYNKDEYLLLEYMDDNLFNYIRLVRNLDAILIKSYMWQLLKGLQYCHKNNIIHLDIKTFSPLALQEDFINR